MPDPAMTLEATALESGETEAPATIDPATQRFEIRAGDDGPVIIDNGEPPPQPTPEPTPEPEQQPERRLPERLRTAKMSDEDKRAHQHALVNGISFTEAVLELNAMRQPAPAHQPAAPAPPPQQTRETVLQTEIQQLRAARQTAIDTADLQQLSTIQDEIDRRQLEFISLNLQRNADETSRRAVYEAETQRQKAAMFDASTARAVEIVPQLQEEGSLAQEMFYGRWNQLIAEGSKIVEDPNGPEFVASWLATQPEFRQAAAPAAPPPAATAPRFNGPPRGAMPLGPSLTRQPQQITPSQLLAGITGNKVDLDTQRALFRQLTSP